MYQTVHLHFNLTQDEYMLEGTQIYIMWENKYKKTVQRVKKIVYLCWRWSTHVLVNSLLNFLIYI